MNAKYQQNAGVSQHTENNEWEQVTNGSTTTHIINE
jgi:hypothetical protein